MVKRDTEPALTSLIESWNNLRAKKGGLRMMVYNSPVSSSKTMGSSRDQDDAHVNRRARRVPSVEIRGRPRREHSIRAV